MTMKTRDEMIREHYMNVDRIMSSGPRSQTSPKSSFMGKMVRKWKSKIKIPKKLWNDGEQGNDSQGG